MTSSPQVNPGNKVYELSDHLGNVRATFADKRLASVNGSSIDDYSIDVTSWSDYYAFGAQMPKRNDNPGDYRYGFNGMEKDDEVKDASGTSYDFGARMYDARVGRWLSVDPLESKYPMLSPYHGLGNNPILTIDPDGRENVIYLTDLRLQNPEISIATKEKIIAELNEIASTANDGFANKVLTPRIVVLTGEIPDQSELDDSDVLAIRGTLYQLNQASPGLTEKGYDDGHPYGMGPERSSNSLSVGNKGNIIQVDFEQADAMGKIFGISSTEAEAWLIQHGSFHNAGFNHGDDLADKPIFHYTNTSVIEDFEPDITSSGPYYQKNPDEFLKSRDKVPANAYDNYAGPGNKFTRNPAKDNYTGKTIEDCKTREKCGG